MVISKIQGGLGNQFFSYARSYSLAKEYKMRMMLDSIIYDTYYFRNFELINFNLDFSECIIRRTKFWKILPIRIYNIIHKFVLKIQYRVKYIQENEEFAYEPIQICSDENYYVGGYWQNYRYFDMYRSELVRQFQLKNPSDYVKRIVEDELNNQNSIAIHVRRGDYKNFKGGKCLSASYYKKAINTLRKKIEFNNVWVFTDDVDYCETLFKDMENMTFVSKMYHLKDIEEFYLMSHCNHFIIANSTFSWWAAYLSEAKEKVIIAPVVDMWKKEFYLPEWITIDTELE